MEVTSGEGYSYDTVIEHWDCSSWKLVLGVEPGYSDRLSGVTALSATSVWAVGVTSGLSFVEQWNGTQWARVSSPNVGNTSNNTFQAATAIPTTGDVWAVGEYYEATSPYQSRTLVEQCQAC